MRIFLYFFFITLSTHLLSQSKTPVKPKTGVKARAAVKATPPAKPGKETKALPHTEPEYTVKTSPLDPVIAKDRAAIVIVLKPNVESVRCGTRYTMNGDTVRPQIDSNGRCKTFVAARKYKFVFLLSKLLRVETDTIALKKNTVTYITVTFGGADENKIPLILYGLDKPVIYVYPGKEMRVDISVNVKGKMIFSYPEYKNGWSLVAHPDGTLETNGHKYDYLFWDGVASQIPVHDPIKGFLIRSDTLVRFFERLLSELGLNPRETQDFITYWAPRMMKNEYNRVHFLFTEEYDAIASIKIAPKPESILRLYLLWGAAEKDRALMPQQLPGFKRKGYSVIEWGGSEIPDPFSNIK